MSGGLTPPAGHPSPGGEGNNDGLSPIELEQAATGLLFIRFLESRGMAVADEETGELIPKDTLVSESLRFARGEE